MTHAYIVLERAGTRWVLPRRVAQQAGPAHHNHVPFVYVEGAKPAQSNLPEAELERLRRQEAVRWAANGLVDPGKRYLVLPVVAGEVVETSRPPQPPVEFAFQDVTVDDTHAEAVAP